MMRPQPRSAIAGASGCASRNGARRCTRHVRSKLCRHLVERLAQIDAGRVDQDVDGYSRACAACGQRRDAGPWSRRDRPRPLRRDLVRRRAAGGLGQLAARALRDQITVAPARPSARAIARPMPELPPVTSAVRPVRSKMACET